MLYDNTKFLNERIYEIGSALFYNTSSSVLRLPATIINVLKVDEAGNLYSLLQRPEYCLFNEEMKFPALLKLYKKGKPFFMEIQGNAILLNDVELLNPVMEWKGDDCLVKKKNVFIVKLKMENIMYYEWKQPAPYKGLKGFVSQCRQWLLGVSPLSLSLNIRPVALQQQV